MLLFYSKNHYVMDLDNTTYVLEVCLDIFIEIYVEILLKISKHEKQL